MLTLSWFITPTGEAIFADDVNYPLKVAGFESTLPGWFWVTGDRNVSARTTGSALRGQRSGLPSRMADLEGLEPPTPWFEAKCSIHLSYRSTNLPVTVAPVSTTENHGLANAGFAFVQKGGARYFPSS